MTSASVTALSLVVLVSACATPPRPTSTVNVPDKLKPAMTESLSMIEAALFDARGNKIGRHYAGPHWESTDGNKILGTVKERADAPTGHAIPWLTTSSRPDKEAGGA